MRVHAATEVQAFNNLFVGVGTPIVLVDPNIPLTDQGNLQTEMPGLADLGGYDYHLVDGSPAIDAGVAVDPVLTPESQYVHPALIEPRPVVGPPDIGAYEFGVAAGTTGGDTDTSGPGTSGPSTTSGAGSSGDSDPTGGASDGSATSAAGTGTSGTSGPGATGIVRIGRETALTSPPRVVARTGARG